MKQAKEKEGAESSADSPDKDEYHDDNRRNGFDSEVSEGIGADPDE